MVDGIKLHIDEIHLVDFNMKPLVSVGKGIYVFKESLGSYNPNKLIFRECATGMIIEGSLQYAMNENGIQFNTRSEQEHALGMIGARLNIDIMKAEVKYFEAGLAVNTPFKFHDFSSNHVGVPGMNLSMHNRNIKIFGDDLRSVKVYDAGYNAKKKVSADKRKELEKAGIFDPKGNYIKYEVKYQKPCIYFKKRSITVEDLFEPSFHATVTKDIIDTYKSMTKTGIKIDPSITTLSTEDILFITLKKLETEIGTIDIQKKSLETLHEHRNLFTASQKCYRKKVINKMAVAFKPDPGSTDITALLTAKLV